MGRLAWKDTFFLGVQEFRTPKRAHYVMGHCSSGRSMLRPYSEHTSLF